MNGFFDESTVYITICIAMRVQNVRQGILEMGRINGAHDHCAQRN